MSRVPRHAPSSFFARETAGEKRPRAWARDRSNAVQVTQGAHGLIEHGRGSVFLIHEVDLIATDILWPEQFRRFAEMPGELGDSIDIQSPSVWG